MVEHYFKVTLRHIRKHLLISILNIAGLAIGIASFVLIMLYVNHELNYDRYNEHFDDIYRVAVDAKIGNTVIQQTYTSAPMPAAMYDEYPEIGAITRIAGRTLTVKIGDLIYNEEQAAAVDSTFTEIFTLNFLEGSAGKMLNEPGQVLLNQSTAQKYFGDNPAYGEVIMIRDTIPLTVIGVYEDLPSQSHFHFTVLISLISIEGSYNNPGWFANNFRTYLSLEPGFPKEQWPVLQYSIWISEGFRNPYYLSVRIAGSDYQKIIKILQRDWEKFVPEIPFEYEILDKHYDGIYKNEKQTRSLLTIFSVIAIIISCLGLFGLASFMAERRTKEIGIRKTNGATTSQILRLLSLDFTKWVLLANIIAWPLTWFAMKKWLESFAYRVDIPIWIFLIAGTIAFLIALATISYHAIHASRQNPGLLFRYE